MLFALACAAASPPSLIDWVRAAGGYVHPGLEFSAGPDPASTLTGLFTTRPIPQGTLLLALPPGRYLAAADDCELARRLRS